MMKRTFLTLMSLCFCIAMMAGSITREQAEQAARAFLSKQQPAASSRMRMASQKQLPVSVASDATAYYVFNIGEQSGYVVVNGNDHGPSILAYADNGSFSDNDMPVNMKAWLQSYADQIEYLERTGGRNNVSQVRRERQSLTPLLASTWNQGAPYNNKCPTYRNQRTVTGCVATALAQVINYYKYPSQTLQAIPAYTTDTHNISMPELPVTTIDWQNMRNSYGNNNTTAQQNAVATLMLLCGQGVKMNYDISSNGGSGAYMINDVYALKHYFGYDATVRCVNRDAFTANAWESLIYNEIANGRPVLYGGQSTGGGHAFVIDGYGSDGLFHVNWGWGGQDDGYFLLSVLNPYNNEAIGSSSSDDGFSFGQDAVVGIQHGTSDVVPATITVYDISTTKTTFTRQSADNDFTGINISVESYNMSGDTHEFYMRLAVLDSNGELATWLSDADSWGQLNNWYGGTMNFNNCHFGKDLADGVYHIVPCSASEDSEAWDLAFGSNTYRLKAVIEGNSLKLTAPSVSLSGSDIIATGSTVVNTTVNVQTQIRNRGTYFNDYLYLMVDNKVVGGRIFEAPEGDTVPFNIEFLSTTTGSKQLKIVYDKGNNNYVTVATGSVTIGAATGEYDITGSIQLPKANSDGNIEGTTAEVKATFRNTGNGQLSSAFLAVDLYKYNSNTQKYSYVTYKGQYSTIAAGGSREINVTFDELDLNARYAMQMSYTTDSGASWTEIDESLIFFSTVEPTQEPEPEEYTITGSIQLPKANSDGNIEGTTAEVKATFRNTGNAQLPNAFLSVDLYKYNSSTDIYDFVSDKGQSSAIAAGGSREVNVTFDELELNARYAMQLSYTTDDGASWTDIKESVLFFSTVEVPQEPEPTENSLDIACNFKNMTDGVIAEQTLKVDVTLTNNGKTDYDGPVLMNFYTVNNLGNPVSPAFESVSKTAKIAAGKKTTLSFENTKLLEDGKKYLVGVFYLKTDESNSWTHNDQTYTFTVNLPKEPEINATLALNTESTEGVIETTTAKLTAQVSNTGNGVFDDAPVSIALYKYNNVAKSYVLVKSYEKNIVLNPGEKTTVEAEFDNLIDGASYRAQVRYSLDGSKWTSLTSATVYFKVVVPTPVLSAVLSMAGTNDEGNIEQSSVIITASVANSGKAPYANSPITITLYTSDDNKNFVKTDSHEEQVTILPGGNTTVAALFSELKDGKRYKADVSYSMNGSTLLFSDAEVAFGVDLSKTAIDDASREQQTVVVYTIEGRRLGELTPLELQALPKGVYIIGGKKYVAAAAK